MREVLLPVVALLLCAPAAPAATSFSTETHEAADAAGQRHRARLIADGSRLRLDLDPGSSVIFRADRGVLWLLDHEQRTYLEIEEGSARALAQRLHAANAEMRTRLQTLPEQPRSQTERLLDGVLGPEKPSPPEVGVRATGQREQVAGIACEGFEVTRNGEKVADVCRASFAEAGVPRERLAAVRQMAAFLRESAAALAPESLRRGGLEALSSFPQLDGVPLRVRAYRNGHLQMETRVTRVEERPARDEDFELPASYGPSIRIHVRQGATTP